MLFFAKSIFRFLAESYILLSLSICFVYISNMANETLTVGKLEELFDKMMEKLEKRLAYSLENSGVEGEYDLKMSHLCRPFNKLDSCTLWQRSSQKGQVSLVIILYLSSPH